jgi:hypothetical protein
MNKLATVALLASLALTGCYKVSVRSNTMPAGAPIEKTAHVFLWGLVGGEVDVACTPALVQTKMGFVDWLIGGVTFGLYTPRSTETYCALPQAAPVVTQTSAR